jgi:hypothetical protein
MEESESPLLSIDGGTRAEYYGKPAEGANREQELPVFP